MLIWDDMTESATREPTVLAADGIEPDVTVVTVVLNVLKEGRREKFRQCLASVQAQRDVHVEHLIVDGASDDGTLDFVRSYSSGDSVSGLRVLSRPDKGIYDAMNQGLEQARGKYVIFLNSDDYYHDPLGLSRSFQALERTSCDFSYAPIRVLRESDDRPVDHPNCHPRAGRIFINMEFSHQSVMFRKTALLDIGGFDLKYRSAADYDSLLRLILTGYRACCIPCSFVTFRMGGYSSVNQEVSQREAGTVFATLYNRYVGAGLTEEAGCRLLLSAYLPCELKERLFPYYVRSFGEGMLAAETDDDAQIPVQLHGLIAFKHRLLPLKKGMGGLTLLCHVLPEVSRHPIWFMEFAVRYRRAVRRIGRRDAAREAFNMMGRRLLAHRRQTLDERVFRRAAAVQISSRVAAAVDVATVGDQALPVHTHVVPSDFWNVYGIYGDEPWGAWADKRMLVKVRVPDDYVGHGLTAALYVGGYIYSGSPKRILRVNVNDEPITTLTLDHIEPRRYEVSVPSRAVGTPFIHFKLELDADFVPAELGHSTDVRRLGITFGGLAVSLGERRT